MTVPKINAAHLPIGTAIALLFGSVTGFALAEPGLESFPRWENSQLVGSGSPPLPFDLEPAYPQLQLQLSVDLDRWPVAGVQKMVALDLTGRVRIFDDTADATEQILLLEIADAGPDGQRGGGRPETYSLTFDPDFPSRPFVYISSNRPDGGWGRDRVSRFTIQNAESDHPECDAASELTIIDWPSKGHNGCDLKFGADGMLYISTGDGDAPGDPNNVGQLTDNLLSSILRVDVRKSTAAEPYRVPDDNPFVDSDGIRPEVWAYGLRNPWRMTFAPDGKTLFVGDNGDENWELVRKVTAGTNHGWSAFEGSHPFRSSNPLSGPVKELTLPAFEHPHSDMRSIIGGNFYQGQAFADLAGTYLYGCYFTGKVWALDHDPATHALTNPRRIADSKGRLVAFAIDHAGEPLVVMLNGPVLRLKSREAHAETKPIPSTLSATGLFSSTSEMKPADGVLPYDINASYWTDGAEKTRWMAVPEVAETDKVDAPSGERYHKSWNFPNGSAFAQTLWFPSDGKNGNRLKVETQVAHQDGGEWRFLTYRWRSDQSDADLVDENGIDAEIEVAGKKMPWRFASRAECSACHTQRTYFVNAVSSEQLMRPFDYSDVGGKPGDQLETLIHIGLFKKNREPARPNADPPIVALTNPYDASAPLDARARAYLYVNCAQCHRESGLGGRAPFELLHQLPLSDTGTVNAVPMVGLPGVENARVIAPGAPERSEILRRMQAEVTGRMPLIGSRLPDRKGIDLIHDWIENMNATDTDTAPTSK